MEVRSLGFRTDLMVRRLAGAEIIDAGGHVTVRTPANPHFWWGNFVLVPAETSFTTAMAVFRDAFPATGHVAIGVDDPSGTLPVAGAGVDPEISVVLAAKPGALAAARPSAAETRVLNGEEDWAQAATLWWDEAAADGAVVDADYQRASAAEAAALCARGGAAFLGGFVDGRLVSCLGIACDDGGVARYQHVFTAPEARGLGLASRLLVEAAELAAASWRATQVVIVADPEAPAARLYRSLGFADVERYGVLQGRPPTDSRTHTPA